MGPKTACEITCTSLLSFSFIVQSLCRTAAITTLTMMRSLNAKSNFLQNHLQNVSCEVVFLWFTMEMYVFIVSHAPFCAIEINTERTNNDFAKKKITYYVREKLIS